MPDTYSRAALDAGRCTFRPKNGRSWSQCYDRAVWADPEPTIPQPMPVWREKRCDKHLRLDLRTAENARQAHGWASDRAERMVPFDAVAAIQAAEAREQAANAARREAYWTEVEAFVAKRDAKGLREFVSRYGR